MSVIRAFNFPYNSGETCYSAQDKELLKLRASGKTLKEIGAILGLHDSTVFYRLKKLRKTDYKVKRTPRISRHLKGKEAEICQMYKAGLNTYEIAKRMGVTSKSIYNVLINQGIPRRNYRCHRLESVKKELITLLSKTPLKVSPRLAQV